MQTLSVGLIGAGFHARTVQLPAMDLVETLRLKGIATSCAQTAAAASERYRVPGYADYRVLLERPDIDAVIIAVSAGTLDQIAHDAIKAGKHVLIETPGIGGNPDLAAAGLDWARQKGLVLQVAYSMRYSPLVDELKKRLDASAVPRLFLYDYYAFVGHMFNLALYLSGPPAEVVGAAKTPAGVQAQLRFTNGDMAVICGRNLNNYSVNIESITVSAIDFWARIEGRRQLVVHEHMPMTDVADWSVGNSRGERFDPHPFAARFLENSGYAGQLRGFVSAIQGGPAPRSTLEDALATRELMQEIDAKADGGG